MTTSQTFAPEAPAKKKARLVPEQPTLPVSSNDALQFHFVRTIDQVPMSQEALDRQKGYNPLFTNQMFEDEQIIGYERLEMDIVICTDTFVPLLLHRYGRKMFPANDYVALLKKEFAEGLPTARAEVDAAKASVESLASTLHDACLKQVHSGATKAGKPVRILQFNMRKAGAALRRLHARIHPLLRFYIDGASELEQSDKRMEVMLAVQLEGDEPVAVLGILTFFKFWIFPRGSEHNARYRVAQILVFPCFQQQGVGALLLQAVNTVADLDAACQDVTYEDPADDLQALRERLDLERCACVPAIWDAAHVCARDGADAQARASAAMPALDAGASDATGNAGTLSAESTAKAGNAAVLSALQPPQAAIDAITKLKLSRHHVSAVWDVLLWAVAQRGASALMSQDEIAQLLEARVLHRTIASIGEAASESGEQSGIPSNKVFLDLQPDLEEGEALTGHADDEEDDDDEVDDDEDDDEGGRHEGGTGGDSDGDAGSGEVGDVGEQPKLRLLLYRKDPTSRAARTAARARTGTAAKPLAVPELNEAARESLSELVTDRLETIERIVHGAQLSFEA